MRTQTGNPPHPLIWAAAIALIVFCGAGVAAMMGWIPTSIGKPEEPVLSKMETKIDKAASPSAGRSANRQTALAPVKCPECGVVQSVREVEVKGEGSGIGAVGGAVVGGVVGNQIGNGRGQDVMTVVGAVGGAFAGNEVEKRMKSKKSYAVTVRFDDGSSRVIHQANAPAWRAGDKVRVINGAIQSI